MLAGGILVVFPSVVSLMFFMFTAPYYSIAVLAGTVGVYCMEKKKEIDALIIWKIDRLSRDAGDYHQLTKFFEK